ARELTDARNEADNRIYQIEKMIKESGDKIKESDKAPILAAVEKLKRVASGDDLSAIRAAIGELEQASSAMAQHLYSQQQPSADGQGASPPPGGETKGKDDVIDAEYEVK